MVDIPVTARHRAQAPDRRRRKLRLGARRGEGVPHRGERAHQAPGCLSRSGGEGTKRRRSFLFRAFVEDLRAGTVGSAGHAPYRAAGSLSSIEGESSTRPSLQRNGTSNLNKGPPPPACVRVEIRRGRDRQTEAK